MPCTEKSCNIEGVEMKRRVFPLVFIMVAAIFCSSGCNKSNAGTGASSCSSQKPTPAMSSVAPLQSQSKMMEQFLEEVKLPADIYEKFAAAIQGDIKAQEWLDKYYKENKDLNGSVLYDVFLPKNDSNTYLESECYYNIGMLYYDGDKDIQLMSNKEKAFYWLNLSADKGSFFGAVQAGDMARSGNGITKNEKLAFNLYEKTLKIKIDGMAYERLANCYENGIGTDADKQKAEEYYFKSTLDGNSNGLYKVANSDGISQAQSILFSKAASSIDYSAGYFEMAYGGLDAYSAGEPKSKVIGRLTEAWNNGTDPVTAQLKKSVCENQYFPKELVETLIKTSYTYSYHAFAEKYGIKPNRSFEEGKKIQIAFSESKDEFDNYDEEKAKSYLEDVECEFYELDFDEDGVDEVGIPIHSGAGGAFMADGFDIFKKNQKGFYEKYASGPYCTMRDAMRLIQYNGRVYFITNPYSDNMDAPHNITARCIYKNGNGHEISIDCNQYKQKEIMTRVYDNYSTDEFGSFLKEIKAQAYEAIATTKRHEMYNPNAVNQVKKTELPPDVSSDFLPMDVYFAADINNDGSKEFVRKGHIITDSKYYNDFNMFHIYDSESKLSENPEPILNILPNDDYYGLHSGGNIYDILPVGGKIVQFWTREKDNKTYCVALTRNELLYSLNVYIVQNKQAVPVCHSLLFDEVQNINVQFTKVDF
jgi:TPR repeat protein